MSYLEAGTMNCLAFLHEKLLYSFNDYKTAVNYLSL